MSKMDVLLNSSEQYIPYFKGLAKKGFWFPNAYPDDLMFIDNNVKKQHDVGFCGSLIGDRQQWLNLLEKRYGDKFKKDIFVLGDDMVNSIRSYKIGMNRSIADDINYRTFETMGCGTALVTNRVINIDRLFNDGEHIIMYENENEMLEKIDHYLNNENELNAIARIGHDIVKRNHTYLERAKLLISIAKSQ